MTVVVTEQVQAYKEDPVVYFEKYFGVELDGGQREHIRKVLSTPRPITMSVPRGSAITLDMAELMRRAIGMKPDITPNKIFNLKIKAFGSGGRHGTGAFQIMYETEESAINSMMIHLVHLKKLGIISRSNQFRKAEEFLNTDVGKKLFVEHMYY